MGDFSAVLGITSDQTQRSVAGGDFFTAVPVEREETIERAQEHFVRQLEQIELAVDAGEKEGQAVLESIAEAINSMLDHAERFERQTGDPECVREMRTVFHRGTHALFKKSYLLNRARTWPNGYQGDHKMLETVYRNIPLSEGLGYYLDLYALNTTLASGVRNRLQILTDILREEIGCRTCPRVLNIGCGSSRELFDLIPEIVRSHARITCLDSDEDALFFSQNRLSYSEAVSQISFRKYNALRLFDAETALNDVGKQDIIYSAGLFDYLDSDFLTKVLSTLYGLLNEGGKLIAPFKDAERYRASEYHWMSDWDGFRQRTPKDFLNVLVTAGIPSANIACRRDETGAIIFYTITK